MADRHDDDVDSWLGERIDPLSPPPGTFDLIKRRARRRKYRRLGVTAGTAVVIVAAAVTVPQVVKLPVLSPSGTSGVQAGQPGPATPTGGGTAASSPAAPSASPSSAAAALAPVPPHFQPTSVTFVGTGTGWVIGQAGTPGYCATAFCTSVARTDNAGKTWGGVHAPLAGAPEGATGVSQIRFLNTTDGWAFGPELFQTHDGGSTWAAVGTNGLRVTDLETVGKRAFALFASCTGSLPSFAGNCTSFTLYSAPAAGGAWSPVGAATTRLTDGRPGEAASLVLTGGRGFLLAPNGALYAGPVDGSGAWQLVNSIISSSCPVGPVNSAANPVGALFSAVSAKELILVCSGPYGTVGAGGSLGEQKLVFSSPNGGASWIPMAAAPPTGAATSVAASPAESILLATDVGIELLPAGDIAWQAAQLKAPVPAGGFSYVGMTTNLQGIAVPANPASGTVWFTFDGGKSWQPSKVTSS